MSPTSIARENRINEFLDSENIYKEYPSTSHRFTTSLSPVKDKVLSLSPPTRSSMLAKRRASMAISQVSSHPRKPIDPSDIADPLDSIALNAGRRH